MKRNRTSSVLVLAELGTEWPLWLNELCSGQARRVLTQDSGEALAALAERAQLTAQQLAAEAPISALVLLCNERTDGEQRAARQELARRLAAKLPPSKRKACLWLTAGSQTGDSARKALLDLAHAIVRERWPATLSVQVRLDDEDVASRPVSSSPSPPRSRVA